MSLFSHLTSIDEVVIGTCINLNKIYHNQINQVTSNKFICEVLYVLYLQLTAQGAVMLADGAVLHILDYLRFDCPENQGSYITIEALSRYHQLFCYLYAQNCYYHTQINRFYSSVYANC